MAGMPQQQKLVYVVVEPLALSGGGTAKQKAHSEHATVDGAWAAKQALQRARPELLGCLLVVAKAVPLEEQAAEGGDGGRAVAAVAVVGAGAGSGTAGAGTPAGAPPDDTGGPADPGGRGGQHAPGVGPRGAGRAPAGARPGVPPAAAAGGGA